MKFFVENWQWIALAMSNVVALCAIARFALGAVWRSEEAHRLHSEKERSSVSSKAFKQGQESADREVRRLKEKIARLERALTDRDIPVPW